MMRALAYKNLWRDRHRTLATIAAVTVGILALLLFLAYVEFIESALSRVAIYQEGNGHLQVYRRGGAANLAADPGRYSLDAADQQAIAAVLADEHGIRRTIAQMSGVGLIQHGTHSTIFLATGVDPKADAALRADSGWRDGGDEHALSPNGILVTHQVADLLRATPGQDVQLGATSYDNRMGAIDTDIDGFYSTGVEAIENKSIKMPLAMMQSLYSTDAVSRVVVQLDDRAGTAAAAARIGAKLDARAPGRFEVNTWNSPQTSQVYSSFMGFFNMLFAFTGTVVLLIAATTVQHTIAMNIRDRLREIGTMRALGFSRQQVVRLFVHESFAIAVIAGVIAAALADVVFAGLEWAGFMTVIPRVANRVPLALTLPATQIAAVAVVAIVLVTLSSWFTAARQIRRSTAAGRGTSASLSRLMAGAAAMLVCAVLMNIAQPVLAADSAPDEATMRTWLRKADLARGGFAGYNWKLKIHAQEPNGTTDTTYDVAVKGSDALARTVEPRRLQGERILIAQHAMWYGKPGLRRPISISPQQRLVGEASNGDIASVQYSTDYKPVYMGEETVDGRRCHKLRLVATNDQVTYAAIVYYLDADSMLAVKADFLTAEGSVFKTAYQKYENKVRVDGKIIPFISSMRIVNASFPDRVSTLEYSDVTPANLPGSLFQVANLTSP
jgi:ABC-type lipoprotein release transport system permease subunit